MSEVYVLATARTPVIADLASPLAQMEAGEFCRPVLTGLIETIDVPPEKIDDLLWAGSPLDDGQSTASLQSAFSQAGFSASLPAAWVTRGSGSAQQAIHFAAQAILAHDQHALIAGGCDVFSAKISPDQLLLQAEAQAKTWDLTRKELDAYVAQSHERYALALTLGHFKQATVPLLATSGQMIREDEIASPYLEPDTAAGITQAHLSQKAVGAAAVLLASPEMVGRFNLNPIGRLIARTVSGRGNCEELSGSVIATQRALLQANLNLPEIDSIFIAESSACEVLAWIKSFQPDPERVNPYGGALVRGWLPTCEGALLLADLFHYLENNHGHYGLVVSALPDCGGMATLVERF